MFFDRFFSPFGESLFFASPKKVPNRKATPNCSCFLRFLENSRRSGEPFVAQRHSNARPVRLTEILLRYSGRSDGARLVPQVNF